MTPQSVTNRPMLRRRRREVIRRRPIRASEVLVRVLIGFMAGYLLAQTLRLFIG